MILQKINHKDLVFDIIINLMRYYIFYGHVLSMLAKIETKGENAVVPTFGVGQNPNDITIKLWYNVDYMDECIEKVGYDRAYTHFFEVMKHEVLHVVFNHLSMNMPDKERQSIAVDLAVNSYLNTDNFIKNPDGSNACMVPQDFGLEPKLSAMNYYQLLENNKHYKELMNNNGNGNGNNNSISDIVKSHQQWEAISNNPVSQEIIKEIIRKSKENCQQSGYGNIPGELMEILDEILKKKKPFVPWKSVLKMFVASNSETDLDYTMKHKSRRFGTRPGTKKQEKLKLAIGIDTSGSISDHQLKLFMNELKWIEKEGAYLYVYECDTRINREYPFKEFDGKISGRGGTDLEPVLKRVSEEKFDALIFFTDFYTSKIEKDYRVPTLWVLSQCEMSKEEFPYLFPKNIYIKIKEDSFGCEKI